MILTLMKKILQRKQRPLTAFCLRKKGAGKVLEGSTESQAQQLVELLKSEAKVI